MPMVTEANREKAMIRHRNAALGLVLLSLALPVRAQSGIDPAGRAAAFTAALVAGDEAMAKSLLDPEVLIYESGGQESSREEYTSHHMKGDMAFLGKARIEVLDRRHGANGDLAWVATRSRITGPHKDKPVDIYSTESLVLKRTPAGWRIVHIQWSSRPVKPKPETHEPASPSSR